MPTWWRLRIFGRKSGTCTTISAPSSGRDGRSSTPCAIGFGASFSPTIAEAQRLVDDWIKTYGVRYFSELTNMACLTEEVGELARVMSRKYGDQSFKAGENTDPADEMADVLWVLLCLANQTGVDLSEAFRRNLEKKTRRDATRHLENPKLKS